MAFRGAIPDFQLANPLYVGAAVSFFTVKPDGTATTTLATLFASPTGTQTVTNPQTLDSEGKFLNPVYIETPIIAEVTGPNVTSHSTGVINPRGTWRGNWATGQNYFSTDFVFDPVSGNLYIVETDYTSSSSLTTDVSAGNLAVAIDSSALSQGGATLAIKAAVQVASAGANLTLSGLQTIDGYTTLSGDRVLAKDQSNPAQNGIYNAQAGAWTRAVDADVSAKIGNGFIVYVLHGTLNAARGWQGNTATPFTLGTSALAFTAVILPAGEIVFNFGNAPDAVIATGVKGYQPVPYNQTITGMMLVADAACSIVLDIYSAPIAQFPPGPANSICAAARPTLSNAQFATDFTLTGWTKALAALNVLGVNVVSVSGARAVTLVLFTQRS